MKMKWMEMQKLFQFYDWCAHCTAEIVVCLLSDFDSLSPSLSVSIIIILMFYLFATDCPQWIELKDGDRRSAYECLRLMLTIDKVKSRAETGIWRKNEARMKMAWNLSGWVDAENHLKTMALRSESTTIPFHER